MTTNAPHILMMAGGTGGHIYPALAVARALMEKGYEISWLGSEGGMEVELVGREDIPMNCLPVKGVRGKGKATLLKAPFTLAACVWKAMKILRKNRTQLVVGFGGFASGPGGIAAALLRRPLVIHEQNAIAGMTNRFLSKVATLTCQAFPDAFSESKKVVTTGNPIRRSLLDKIARKNETQEGTNQKPNDKRAINILIVGGSRGAKVLNDTLPVIFADKSIGEKIQVRHQTGAGNQEKVQQNYDELNFSKVDVLEYIHDMDDAYAWADLVICRAGALTVSEVAVMELPAVFVPYPFAVDDHQTANAMYLVKQDAAKVVQQNDIHELSDVIHELINQPEQLKAMAENARRCAVTDATDQIASRCEEILRKKAA